MVTGESVSFINWDPQQPTGLGTVSIMFGYDDPNKFWGINGQCKVASDVVYPSNGIPCYTVIEIPANLTNVNGCDSTAILNLTINNPDTSYTNITTCISFVWNGTTYDSSGAYYSNTGSYNNYSMSFDGNDQLEYNLPNYNSGSFSIQLDAFSINFGRYIIPIKQSSCINYI